jgi:hypothetical protein
MRVRAVRAPAKRNQRGVPPEVPPSEPDVPPSDPEPSEPVVMTEFVLPPSGPLD